MPRPKKLTEAVDNLDSSSQEFADSVTSLADKLKDFKLPDTIDGEAFMNRINEGLQDKISKAVESRVKDILEGRKTDIVIDLNVAGPQRPKITSPEWNDYVLEQLRGDEKDPQGNPNIDGLRRLVEDVLGDILHSAPAEHFEGATQSNGMRATVAHVLKIAWGGDRSDIRTFGAVADVYSGNTDEEYARYPGATADTRAEARALRKALRLKKVVAAEEITTLPVTESGLGQYIVNSQVRGISNLCGKLDIDVLAFVNSGQHDYDHITHIRYNVAQQMLEQLNRYMQNPDRIPDNIKGFKENWQKEGK